MLELADTLKGRHAGGVLVASPWERVGRGSRARQEGAAHRYIEEKSGMPRDEWVNDQPD
jgi:hypothetical protein